MRMSNSGRYYDIVCSSLVKEHWIVGSRWICIINIVKIRNKDHNNNTTSSWVDFAYEYHRQVERNSNISTTIEVDRLRLHDPVMIKKLFFLNIRLKRLSILNCLQRWIFDQSKRHNHFIIVFLVHLRSGLQLLRAYYY